MAFTENGNNMVMPVAPAYGNGNGFGGFGGDDWWIFLLFLLCGGGYGFGGFGGYGMGMLGMEGYGLYPWLNNSQNINDGFRQQMLNDNITSIRDGVQGLSTQLCNSTSTMQLAMANGFAGVEQGANNRQMANMQTAFSQQTAMNQGFSNVQSQLAQCCCDNRLATCQTQNIIQNEANATRFADANNTRDIIDATTRGNQAILDKLCQLELDNYKTQIDAKNDIIAQLRQENLYARGQASQDVQTAILRENNATVANQLLSEMRSCPIPAQPVYGSQPIFTCNSNNCGCGCN